MCHGPTFTVRVNWVTHFIAGHPELEIYWGTKLDKACCNGLNQTTLWSFKDAVSKVYDEENPDASQIFSMDETSLLLGTGLLQVVVAESGQCHQHQAEDRDCKLVTSIVTICMDRTKLKEMVVFCGKNVMGCWGEDNPGNLQYTVLAKGYTNKELGVAYIEDFHGQTSEKSRKTRILFVNGHNSHCTVEILDFTAEHNIIIISYPPHCIHALQGLDVTCFGVLKTYWMEEHEHWECNTGGKS
ncbi:hypothetical protein FRB95_001454 [Tulasnella sp. JGI-2019a]|nr:hypothetical protein FRB95_001454 [Tulasnella sp. JGI-2019a]